MKKDSRFRFQGSILWLLIFGFWILNLALPTPSLSAVDCTIPNDWTGLCDGNYKQCPSGFCCKKLDDCNSVNPQDLPAFSHDTTGTGAVNSDLNKGSSTSSSTSPLCGENNKGVKTAIGCLMAGDPKQLISQLLGWGVSVGGGIAFLMIVFAGFQMTTAGGDPKKVQAAKELLVSALSGLVIIVLSVVLLNFIGVSVLGLEKFGLKL